MKMRNLLEEFRTDHGIRPPSILGVREHVFTGRSAICSRVIGWCYFVTLLICLTNFFWLNMQCFIFGLVHVQSRNELCDIGPTCVGKSFEVSGLLPVYLLCRKSIQTRFLHILSWLIVCFWYWRCEFSWIIWVRAHWFLYPFGWILGDLKWDAGGWSWSNLFSLHLWLKDLSQTCSFHNHETFFQNALVWLRFSYSWSAVV